MREISFDDQNCAYELIRMLVKLYTGRQTYKLLSICTCTFLFGIKRAWEIFIQIQSCSHKVFLFQKTKLYSITTTFVLWHCSVIVRNICMQVRTDRTLCTISPPRACSIGGGVCHRWGCMSSLGLFCSCEESCVECSQFADVSMEN